MFSAIWARGANVSTGMRPTETTTEAEVQEQVQTEASSEEAQVEDPVQSVLLTNADLEDEPDPEEEKPIETVTDIALLELRYLKANIHEIFNHDIECPIRLEVRVTMLGLMFPAPPPEEETPPVKAEKPPRKPRAPRPSKSQVSQNTEDDVPKPKPKTPHPRSPRNKRVPVPDQDQ